MVRLLVLTILTLEHLLYGHPCVVLHLCRLFNLCLKQHGFVPDEFGRGIIIPLIKDKCDDLTSSDNYRGITISPMISKVFGLCVLNKFDSFLGSNELQLGLKKHLGCSLLTRLTDSNTLVCILFLGLNFLLMLHQLGANFMLLVIA